MRHSDSAIGGIVFASHAKELQLAYVLALTLKRYSVPLTVVAREYYLTPEVISKFERCVSFIALPNSSTETDFDTSLYKLSPYDITFRFDPRVMMPNTAMFLEAVPSLAQLGVLSGVPYTLMANKTSDPSKVHYRQLRANDSSDCIAHRQIFGFTKSKRGEYFFRSMKDIADSWPKSETFTRILPLTSETLYSLTWKRVCGGNPTKGIPFINMDSRMWNTNIPDKWPEKLPYSLKSDATLTISSTHIKLPIYYHEDSFLTDTLIENLESACSQS